MKYGILAALAGLALVGTASAQEPVLTWNYTGFNSTATVAWALKTPAAAGKLPEIMLAQDTRAAGKAPQIQIATLEVDCPKRTVRPILLDTYNTQFVKTDSRVSKNGHSPFMGVLEYSLNDFCASRSQATKQATAVEALKWIDLFHPVAVAAVTPPSGTNLSFELAGNNAQGEDSWLETTTIAHDGKSARAWVLQAWRNGWLPGNAKPTEKPATWRFYEFQCEANVRHRNPAWIQLDPKLDAANTMKVAEGEFTPPSSQPQKQIAKRVCNNRPMLFSETFKGSDKELIASWYNAAAHVGVAAKPVETPRYTAVDLGPTIRFTILDGSFKYTGAFTRESPTSYLYKGEFHPDTAPASTIKDTLSVLGIRNGMLYLNSNYRESPYAIPVTNGKVSGKGILYSERGDDDFSWSLIEPTTVALKAAPVAPTPVPAPAVPAPVPVAPKPAPVVPAAPAPAPAAPAAKSAMNIQYDAAGWRVFTADSTHAIAWADAHAPAGAPPRLHIMYTFAVDTHFNASPRDARTYYWTIDLDCAGNKFRLEQDRYLNQNGIEINVNPSQTNWRAAAQLQEAEPVMKQKCSGATPTGDLTYGAARSTHTWLQTKIVR